MHLSDFGFGDMTGGMEFAAFGGGEEDFSGPYLPAAMECLSCGVCLGACPTYRVRPEENYAPRGRIRLIERVLRDR